MHGLLLFILYRSTYFNGVFLQSRNVELYPVAKPARFLVMQLQILNDYHDSFL